MEISFSSTPYLRNAYWAWLTASPTLDQPLSVGPYTALMLRPPSTLSAIELISLREAMPVALKKSLDTLAAKACFSRWDMWGEAVLVTMLTISGSAMLALSEAISGRCTLLCTPPVTLPGCGAKSPAIASVRVVPYRASATSPVSSASVRAWSSRALAGLASLMVWDGDTGWMSEAMVRRSQLRAVASASPSAVSSPLRAVAPSATALKVPLIKEPMPTMSNNPTMLSTYLSETV